MKTGSWVLHTSRTVKSCDEGWERVLQTSVIGKSCDKDWEMGTSGISDREVL